MAVSPQRPLVRALIGAAVLLCLPACGGTSDGTPTAADPTATTTPADAPSSTAPPTSDGPSLDGVDPCELVTVADLAQLGLPDDPRPGTVVGRDVCNWAKPGLALGVLVDPRAGLADLNTDGASRVEDRTVGSHQGRLVEKPDGHCDIDIAITEKSSVTVSITMIDDPAGACPVAERAAALVEPRLPRG